MNLMKVARIPPIVATPDMTVFQASIVMAHNDVGAIVITDATNKVLGIFTERDNLLRVTLKKRDPEKTRLSEVMTAPVQTVPPDTEPQDALTKMLASKYRHLPIVDHENRIVGVVSVRHLLMRRVSEQQNNIETLSAYVEAGGPG